MSAEPETETQTTPRKVRVILRGQDLLNRVAELVGEGKRAMEISRLLHIPYHQAARLRADCYEEVWGHVEERYGPEAMAQMKQDLIESNLDTVYNCDRAVEKSFEDNRPNTRPYSHKTSAIKVLSSLGGFNAPVQIETTDRKVYALVNPAMHARIMADPKARAAMLALEEFASMPEQPDPVVIDVPTPPWEDSP
jgi:hypothetical protein